MLGLTWPDPTLPHPDPKSMSTQPILQPNGSSCWSSIRVRDVQRILIKMIIDLTPPMITDIEPLGWQENGLQDPPRPGAPPEPLQLQPHQGRLHRHRGQGGRRRHQVSEFI